MEILNSNEEKKERRKRLYKLRYASEPRETALKRMIKLSGRTQREIATLADVEYYQLSKLATGNANDCYLTTAKRICNALGCTLEEAFGD